MRRRFRRHHPHAASRHGEHEGMPAGRRRRMIRTMFWSGAALVLLLGVLGYDRSEVKQAQEFAAEAREAESRSQYEDAVRLYQRAFENPRLSRAKKAEIAVAIGNLEFERFKDYGAAHNWYQRAKRTAPQVADKPETRQRMRDAERFASEGSGRMADGSGDGQSSGSAVRQVELLSPPPSDLAGPVLARFDGGVVRAGELDRALRELPPATEEALRKDPTRLREFLQEYLQRVLIYRAALDGGFHRDPALAARLYDYQRTLISEGYVTRLRENSAVVPNEKVEQYYQANQSRFVQAGKVALAMIKTASSDAAAAARKELVDGRRFGDVATSYSIDQASARAEGVVGMISDRDTSVPGVGVAPKLVKDLMTLKPNDVTSPTRVNDAWFIFKVLSVQPARTTTLEEARPEIESRLRAQQGSSLSRDLAGSLVKQYHVNIDNAAVGQFRELAQSLAQTTSTLHGVQETTFTETAGGTR